MAKKSSKSKKSRFGNPAKAAANTGGAHVASLDEARVKRSMETLRRGFALWLSGKHRGDQSIDISLMILDDFIGAYLICDPQADFRSLMPDAVDEVIETAASINPQATFALRSGIRDFIEYLVESALWTGTMHEVMALQETLKQPEWPGLAPGTELNLDSLRPDPDWLDPKEFELSDIFVPELSRELVLGTVRASPLWKNAEALLMWIGGGKSLTAKSRIFKKDQPAAFAALSHSGGGSLDVARRSSATADELEDDLITRFNLYWGLLVESGLIEFKNNRVLVSSKGAGCLADAERMALAVGDLLDHFIFNSTLAGSEPGQLDDWHLDMTSFLVQCASETPPKAAMLISALESPETAHPDLLEMAKNVRLWAMEGLVTVDERIEVPPAYRVDVAEMFKEDFTVKVIGPGAGTNTNDLLTGI
ncbi:hypothetical protein ART_3197 [Arthrobacter sp. PAMC 25486]|uniref:hypothetical protein n=1 Tax=Arthrobacter sp. PAMC 25486 TaxID=1494608 RepID=UPI000535CE9B|nr:hypothetical protein [Arthrobacter sp. PAMC 25486]AIY02796.1 hypothetical protein ART_3197 [Arthrobacter sp. PAMC 25486]